MEHMGWLEVHVVDHCNNNCRWCHNYSPFSPQREYAPDDYFDGLDVLKKNNIQYGHLSLMGGEPFLHSNLHEFAFAMIERYRKPLMITTNGFWLSEQSIRIHKDLWKILSILKISRYPTIENRLGGIDAMQSAASLIKKFNPHIHIDIPSKFSFNKLEFSETPNEIETYCWNSQCTALLPNMVMGRCGAGAYAHLAPANHLSDAFLANKHMLYDLRKFNLHSFLLWRNRYPLDACQYCSFAKKMQHTNWKTEKGKPPFNLTYEKEHDFYIGKRLIASNDDTDAEAMVIRMQKQYGENAEEALLQGMLAAKRGHLHSALNHVSRALEMSPANQEARTYLQAIRRAIS